jgi:hypothetical protein
MSLNKRQVNKYIGYAPSSVGSEYLLNASRAPCNICFDKPVLQGQGSSIKTV